MFDKKNLLKLLIGIVIVLVLGAIIVPIALDPEFGIVKKKKDFNKTNDNSIETIEEIK